MARSRRSRIFLVTVLLILAAYFFLFLIYPTLYVVARSLVNQGRLTLEFYHNTFIDIGSRRSLVNSLAIGFLVTAFTTVLALPLAMATVKRDFPGKGWVHALVLLPMIMPPFIGAIGLRQMLARSGSVNLLLAHLVHGVTGGLTTLGVMTAPWHMPAVDWLAIAPFWAVVFLEVLHLYPIMYLNVVASLANVDPSLEEAAANLGGGGWNVFRTVTFPLMLPGYFAGASIVFIWAFTDLGAPLVLNFKQVIPSTIYDMSTRLNTEPKGYVLVMITLFLTAVFYLLARRLMHGRTFTMMSKGALGTKPPRASARLTLAIYCFLGALTVLALLPHIAVVLSAFTRQWSDTVLPTEYTLQNFVQVFSRNYTVSSVINSLVYSAGATLVVLVLGILIAYLLVRQRFAGAQALDALTMLPLALPGIVLAFGYLTAYYDVPVIGIRFDPLIFIIVAYSMRRLPYMVRAAVAGFQQVSPALEEASVNLGATAFATLRRITVPLVIGNLLAGGLLTFVFSMFEVSCSLLLLQRPEVFSFAPALYKVANDAQRGVYEASAFGLLGMLVLAVSLVLASRFLGRRMGEVFRI